MKSFRQIFEEQEHEYNSLHFELTGADAKAILAFGSSIPGELIYRPGGGREFEPHITVKYGINEILSKALVQLLEGTGPVKLTLGHTSRFETESCDVLKIDVHSDDIIRLNKLVTSTIKCVDKFATYTPHLTIAYMNRGSAEPYVMDNIFLGKKLSFDSIIFAAKDGLKSTIILR
jgi:2'-5' RNA ligase